MVSAAQDFTRVPLIVLAALAMVSCCSSPDWDHLEAGGNAIVREIEGYRSVHGEYPPSLEAAGAHQAKTQWGDWTYTVNATEGFFLSVGDYGRDCFELYYSPKVGWTRSS
jgi:hypothetical protein